MRQKEPLRTLNEREERELQRVVKASSERVDVVKRAQALLAVRAGKADQTAMWSLSRLQRALRRSDLPQIARETIRLTLHECGYSYQRTRTWVRTGYALRVRKSGTVTTYDPETLEKKD